MHSGSWQGFSAENIPGFGLGEACAVGAVIRQGVPDVARRDQGGQGWQCVELVGVARAALAFVVVEDGVQDGKRAGGPEADGELSAMVRVLADEGGFGWGEGSRGLQEAVGEDNFAEVVEEG